MCYLTQTARRVAASLFKGLAGLPDVIHLFNLVHLIHILKSVFNAYHASGVDSIYYARPPPQRPGRSGRVAKRVGIIILDTITKCDNIACYVSYLMFLGFVV